MPVSLPNLVLCGGLPLPKRAAADTLELDTSSNAPANKRVFLKLDPLTERLVDDLDPVMADAVEIASYVFTADRLIERGSDIKKISKAEAVVRGVVIGALKGDPRNVAILFRLAEQAGQFQDGNSSDITQIQRVIVRWQGDKDDDADAV